MKSVVKSVNWTYSGDRQRSGSYDGAMAKTEMTDLSSPESPSVISGWDKCVWKVNESKQPSHLTKESKVLWNCTLRERQEVAGPLSTRAIMCDEMTKIWEHIGKNLLSRGKGDKEEPGRQPRGTNDGCTRTGTHQKINTGWGPPPHTALERVTYVRGRCETQARTANTRRYNQVDGLAGTVDRDSSKSGGEQTR